MRPHIIYGYQLSYFTRKVEAAYQLLNIRHAYTAKTIFNMRRVEAGEAVLNRYRLFVFLTVVG